MARKRRGQPVNGWLILDKPVGLTSMRAVSKVRAILDAAKLGHAGTLDPMASGVLPVALGEATKTMAFVTDSRKHYRFTAVWGEERDTDDAEGRIIATSDARPGGDRIAALLADFSGVIAQVPPQYSAIKINGQRAYKLARRGEEPAMTARQVEIFSIRAVDDQPPGPMTQTVFEVTCGKGTYVRALARDMGRKLGCYGYVGSLRRTAVGAFSEAGAISLDKLQQLVHSPPPYSFLLPIETPLDDIPAVAVTGGEADSLRHGQAVFVPSRKAGTVLVRSKGLPVAIATLSLGRLTPNKVFNL